MSSSPPSGTLRRSVKAAIDFLCGVAAVLIGYQVTGPADVPLASIVLLCVMVGSVVALANAAWSGYRTIWHYTSMAEAAMLAIASIAVLVGLALVLLLQGMPLARPSVLLIPLLVLALTSGVRMLRRWHVAFMKRRDRMRRSSGRPETERRVLVAGAGDAGLLVSRDFIQSAPRGVQVVGFLDDDRRKFGTILNGAPVLGPLSALLQIAAEHQVTELVVAMPSAPPNVIRTLLRTAEDSGIRVRHIPGIADLVVGGQDMHRPGSVTLHELVDSTILNRARYRGSEDGARRVLVTGGGGYIGSHLTRLLLDRGYHVRVLDSFAYGRAGIEEIADHPRLEVLQGDICNLRDVSYAVRDVDGVLALAAIVGDPACNLDPEETINLNYASTKILVEACNFYGVRRLVFASSCSVYGASEGGSALTERSRLNPVSLYARTRVLSENIIFDRRGSVEPVVLRLATVFGLSPRMRFDLVVNTLTARAVVDQRISIFGGDQWRPSVHCRDAARAFLLALEGPAEAVSGEIFNVGGDNLNHRIRDIGEQVAEIVGDVEVAMQADAPDPRDYRVNFEKIRRTLDFEPEFSIADGIREVAAAVRRNAELQRHNSPIYHNVHALRRQFEDSSPYRHLIGALE